MKFTAAALAFAVSVAANYPAANGTVYTTETVSSVTIVCPGPTTLTHGDQTYTVAKPTTLTLTEGPYTVSKPVYVTSSVVCHKCNGTAPTYSAAPPPPAGTGAVTPTQSYPPTVTAGAGKAVVFSGAGLAAALGLAALL